MALTGLFLCLFLLAHLAGNLQLLDLTEDGRLKFNEYAMFMTTFPLVKIVSYLLYASILLHAVDGIVLAVQNYKARPVRYRYEKAGASSKWYSRQMALLGVLLLVFIIIHMRSFWYEMHFGSIGLDANGNKDLATITIAAFKQWWYVAFYVFSMLVLAFHLLHGFKSAFQTLGINHPKYNKGIHTIGMFFGVFIPVLFALIPLWILLKS